MRSQRARQSNTPGFSLFNTFSGVGWKIMAPYLVLTAFFAVFGTFLVTRLVTGSLEERFNNQLIETSRVASDSVVRAERNQLESVRAISFTSGVAEAIAARDPRALENLVVPIAANRHIERVEVLGADGSRIFSATSQPGGGLPIATDLVPIDRRGWPFVPPVLAGEADAMGDKFAGFVNDSSGWILYTSAPITEGGRLVGVVLVGTQLSSFLAAAKLEALADLTVFAPDGALLGTTFADPAESGLALTSGRAPTGQRKQVSIFGRDYDALYAELRVRGEPAGSIAVALPSEYIANAGSTARTQMALLFGGITLAVVLIGGVLARKLTRPLNRLLATTREVTAGDLTVRTNVTGRDEIGALARSFDAMTEKLESQHLATIGALTSAIDARDPYTAGHSIRVGRLSATIGTEFGMAPARLHHLEVGGYLHDIGKIGVRDSVLLKEGALSPQERELIERHPRIGLDILEKVDLAPEVRALVGGHHERLDGTGYPLGLSGDEISIFPRIASVADFYDAITTDRPYRKAMTLEEALSLLQREADSGRIDPEVLRVLRLVAPRWEERRRDDPEVFGYERNNGRLRKAA